MHALDLMAGAVANSSPTRACAARISVLMSAVCSSSGMATVSFSPASCPIPSRIEAGAAASNASTASSTLQP